MGAVPVITVTGWSNSGKTTFVTRVVGLLTDMGSASASPSITAQDGGVDVEAMDSWKYAQAGANPVCAQRFGPVRYLCEHAAGRADAR